MSTESEQEIYPFPGNVKSSVWKYFGFYNDPYGKLDKSKAICRLCRRAVNYTGNTTNLRAHVVHHHRGEEGVEETQRTLQNRMSMSVQDFTRSISNASSSTSFSYSPAVQEQVKLKTFGDCDFDSAALPGKPSLNSAMLNFIVNKLVPLETIDSPAFRNLMQTLGNNKIEVVVPKVDEISNILMSNYYSIKQKVAACLTRAESEYMKVEIWKTINSNYMTVSVQLLMENWKAASYVLNTLDLGEKYCPKDITDLLSKTVQEWGLSEELIILSDDSQEITEATASLSAIQLTSLGVAINKTAALCMEHPVVCSLLKHVRDITELFKENPNAALILLDKQKVLQLSGSNLIMSERGSWKSALEMLESFDELSAAVMASFNDPNFISDSKVKMVTPKETSVLQSLIAMLKPLQTAYSLTHSMKCPTMAVILPVLKKLEVALSSSECDAQVMIELKDKMLVQLGQGYSKKQHRELLLLSSLLDPRFKDLKFVDQWEQELAYDLLKQSCVAVNNRSHVGTQSLPQNEADSASPQDTCIKIEINDDHEFSSCSSEDATAVAMLVDQLDQISRPVKRRRKNAPQTEILIQSDPMNDWLADVVQEVVPSDKQEDNISNEISRYKAEMQILSTSSPLAWWRDRMKTYPILSHVAKKYACAPAILSEMNENKRSIYERQRASLSDSSLEMMVFLNANMSLT